MLREMRKAYGATVYRQTRYHGAMRKYASWNQERVDQTIEVLDLYAHRPVAYDAPSVRVRKAR